MATAVIAVTPVVIAGAYTGAKSAECGLGSGTPVLRQWHVAHLARKRLSPTALAFKEFVFAGGRELLHAESVPISA